MDVPGLRTLLHAVLVDLERGRPVDGEAVAAHLDALPELVADATPEEIRGLLEDIEHLTRVAVEAQGELGALIEEVNKGRRGNRGYNSLKAFRKAQRLYRRV